MAEKEGKNAFGLCGEPEDEEVKSSTACLSIAKQRADEIRFRGVPVKKAASSCSILTGSIIEENTTKKLIDKFERLKAEYQIGERLHLEIASNVKEKILKFKQPDPDTISRDVGVRKTCSLEGLFGIERSTRSSIMKFERDITEGPIQKLAASKLNPFENQNANVPSRTQEIISKMNTKAKQADRVKMESGATNTKLLIEKFEQINKKTQSKMSSKPSNAKIQNLVAKFEVCNLENAEIPQKRDNIALEESQATDFIESIENKEEEVEDTESVEIIFQR